MDKVSAMICSDFTNITWNVLLVGLISFLAGIIFQFFLINIQRRFNVTQVQKSYGVGIDVEIKGATPTMGGGVFVLAAVAAAMARHDAKALSFWSLPILCGVIGFIDDWLKFSKGSSEGFSSLRKLVLQVFVGTAWVIWVWFEDGLFLWPGLNMPAAVTVPFTILAVVGAVNAVNFTDGLDGLAGGAFAVSLGILGYILMPSEFLSEAFAVLMGLVYSFLLLNIRPARIFMGDTGSHFLGGALVALCVQGNAVLALIPAGFIFGIELISSAVQIAAIRCFGKKIFLMAPLHHHFQRMGWDETTVTLRFLVIHAAGGAVLAILFVLIGGF